MAEKEQTNEQRRKEAQSELGKGLKKHERSESFAPFKLVLSTVLVLAVIVGGLWLLITHQDPPECVYTASDTNPAPEGKDVGTPSTDNMKKRGTSQVVFNTNYGKIPVELDNKQASCAVNSMTYLIEKGFYDNTVCHRILNDNGTYVLQCGDPTGTGMGGPGYTFPDEYPASDKKINDGKTQTIDYERGTLAMANAGPDTNGSQFFFVFKDSQFPPSYTKFGTISDEGLKTLDKIAAAEKDAEDKKGKDKNPEIPAPEADKPLVTIDIVDAKVIKED